jgi:MFS family permease
MTEPATATGSTVGPTPGTTGGQTDAPERLPAAGRAALRAGVVGNWIDNVHVFLPLTALTPALAVVAGPGIAASTGALVVIAMMLGRPIGGMIFGRVSDRLGRTRTTKIAISGTALCALAIALMPTHDLLGVGTIVLILLLRFLGGIFVAGEYSAAIPLAMEWSAPRRRGFMSGLILSMAPWAQASVAFAAAGTLAALGSETYAAWGWRVLFAIGAACSGGMLLYYRSRVVDAPQVRRRLHGADAADGATAPVNPSVPDASSTDAASADAPSAGGPSADAPQSSPRPTGLRAVLLGRYARAFWQVFTIMTGLWLLTNTTVILLTARLGEDSGLSATAVSIAMGIASVAQALTMALAGHLSSLTGRRRLLIGWGAVAAIFGPLVWWATISSPTLGRAALCAAILQMITVAAYGPIAAYLSERFPTHVRSTGYGMGYSLSLIVPALYPFYLPGVEGAIGPHAATMALISLGGLLVLVGAAVGPRLGRRELDQDLDQVAADGERG